jgi:hypothetical protein
MLPATFPPRRIIVLILFVFSGFSCFSQDQKTINTDEIPQRKIRKFVKVNEIDTMHNFSLIHASWKKENKESDFNVTEKTYYLKYRLSKVWECYRHANFAKSFEGHSSRIGLMISKKSNSAIYRDNPLFPEVDTGQVYFLNLRLIKGLFNIPVAFEITSIKPAQQILELSYIDANKSKGKQTLQFFDYGKDRTRIVHRTYFKSDSKLRDDLFYPYFHKRLINNFHRNMKRSIRA